MEIPYEILSGDMAYILIALLAVIGLVTLALIIKTDDPKAAYAYFGKLVVSLVAAAMLLSADITVAPVLVGALVLWFVLEYLDRRH